MADRLIRDELLESDRWLDLHSDTTRLAYVGLLLLADDFGNLEGGPAPPVPVHVRVYPGEKRTGVPRND